MPRLSVILAPFSLAVFTLSAHAARQDGLVVYLTFDDANAPLKNFAPVVPGREPIEPVKIGEALEPKFTEGRYGKAALFNSPAVPRVAGKEAPNSSITKDWAISLGKLDDIYAGSFTVSCWVYIPKPNPGIVIGNKESFNIATGWALTSGFSKHYLVNPLGGTPQTSFTSDLESKWRHLAFAVNRTDGSAKVYVDGKFDKDFKLPSADAKLGDDFPTVIGAAAKGAFGTQCTVDEVGIWSRALSVAEISALGTGKRIPEASSYAWAALSATTAAAAFMRRRHGKKS